jgi:hypothetical protein
MERIDFKDWLDDPVTQYFIKYLKDSAKFESTILADMIVGGDIVPLDDQLRISTLAITLNQISEITFEEIDSFYQK